MLATCSNGNMQDSEHQICCERLMFWWAFYLTVADADIKNLKYHLLFCDKYFVVKLYHCHRQAEFEQYLTLV